MLSGKWWWLVLRPLVWRGAVEIMVVRQLVGWGLGDGILEDVGLEGTAQAAG